MSWPSQQYPLRDDDTFGPPRHDVPVTVIVALLVGVATTGGLVFAFRAPMRSVPAVVGAELSTARQSANRRGFRLVVVGEKPDRLVPIGHVASQTPLARSSLRVGRALEVRLSSGPPHATPSASGAAGPSAPKPSAAAAGPAAGGGQAAAAVAKPTAAKPAGSADGSAAGGAAAVATPTARRPPSAHSGGQSAHRVVKLRSAARVPRVVKLRLPRARRILQRAGLSVGSVRYKSDYDVEEGRVLRQTPSPGSAPRGSSVDLVVNRHDY